MLPPSARAVALVAAMLSLVAAPPARGGGFHLFAGAFHHQWRTEGPHGHRVDCRTRACEDDDWRRGNLDSSLGFRLGVERVAWRHGRLEALWGGEVDAVYTEYDLSQRDVTLVEGFLSGGLAVDAGWLRLAARLGGGGVATTDGRRGRAVFGEVGIEVPLDAGAALRLAARRSYHGGPHGDDLSLLLVSRGGSGEPSRWDVEFFAGAALPGTGPGRSLGLASGPLWQLAALRPLGKGASRLGAVVGSARRASRFRALYGSIPGNQRGREVWNLGLTWDRRLWRRGDAEARLTAALWAADWSDDGPLLVDESREKVAAGVEVGGAIGVQGALVLGGRMRLLAGVEQGYWPVLRLGETRVRLGLGVAGRGAVGASAEAPGGRGEGTFPRRLASDLGVLVCRPAHLDGTDWRRLAWGLAAVAGTTLLDDEIRDAVRDRSGEGSRDLAKAFRPVSFWGPLAGLAGTWISSRVAGADRTRIVTGEALEAVLLTVAVAAPVLKETIGRARPSAGEGSGSFSPFSGRQSMPSGEVAQAFALAWVAQQEDASPWLRTGLWGFAGAVVWSRLELDQHWASDAVAGALVGVGVAEWVVHRGRRRRGVVWAATPLPGGVAMQGRVSW